ncbi:MAG: hypothetical protein KDK64_07335 [Chlamydiia bacterium]|nr:hypothetical protein [Chlamydiia bacterium]
MTQSSDPPLSIPPIKRDELSELRILNYEKIGSGPFEVDSELQRFPFPDLSDQLQILSRSQYQETQYLLALRGAQMKKVVHSGEKLYLTYENDQLVFSDVSSPLWVKVLASGEGRTTLEMGVDVISQEGKTLLSQAREVAIGENEKPFKKEDISDAMLLKALEALGEARWWAPDRLFERYEGEEYQIYKGLERLEIPGEQILFAEEGKWFVWKEDRWKVGKEQGLPSALVREVSPYKMEWDVWDGRGLEWTRLTFHRERVRPLTVRMEEVLTRLRQRTSTRISCRIDNRATILKVGDWLFRTERGWHTVKSSYEVDAIVKFKVMGELFIFDGLEKQEGKEVFCGTLFDPMRVEQQIVRLPITQMRTLEHSPSTKKGRSTKIQPPTSSDLRPNKSHRMQPIEDYEVFEE